MQLSQKELLMVSESLMGHLSTVEKFRSFSQACTDQEMKQLLDNHARKMERHSQELLNMVQTSATGTSGYSPYSQAHQYGGSQYGTQYGSSQYGTQPYTTQSQYGIGTQSQGSTQPGIGVQSQYGVGSQSQYSTPQYGHSTQQQGIGVQGQYGQGTQQGFGSQSQYGSQSQFGLQGQYGSQSQYQPKY